MPRLAALSQIRAADRTDAPKCGLPSCPARAHETSRYCLRHERVMVATSQPDDELAELLAADWQPSAKAGWWRDPVSTRIYPRTAAVEIVRRDAARDARAGGRRSA